MSVDTEETVRGDSIARELNGKILIFAKEVPIQLHPQHTDRWTNSTSYVDVVGSLVEIDFNDWPNHTMYMEIVGFIGDTHADTAYWQLYNTTDSVAVADSELNTTSATSTRLRTGALAKLTGTKRFKLQHKSVGGVGDYTNSVMSRILFRADV